MLSRLRVGRDEMLLFRQIPVARFPQKVIELNRLIPASLDIIRHEVCARPDGSMSDGPTSETGVICSAPVWPQAEDGVHEKSQDAAAFIDEETHDGGGDQACSLQEPELHEASGTTAMGAPGDGPPNPAKGCIDEIGSPHEQAITAGVSVEFRRTLRKNMTMKMPWKIVEAFTCDANKDSRVSELALQLRSVANGLPDQLRQDVTAHAYSDAQIVLETAMKRKQSIGVKLQNEWQCLSAVEKAPWIERHAKELEAYSQAVAGWQRVQGTGEPKRPAGAFYMWMRENLEIEWNRPWDCLDSEI